MDPTYRPLLPESRVDSPSDSYPNGFTLQSPASRSTSNTSKFFLTFAACCVSALSLYAFIPNNFHKVYTTTSPLQHVNSVNSVGRYNHDYVHTIISSLLPFFQSPTVHVDDNAVTVTVPTGDCGPGLYCRTVLLTKTTSTGITFFTSYYIYPSSGEEPRNVDSQTRDRVKNVTPEKAANWADQLLQKMTEQEIDITSLSLDAVTAGIMQGKDIAATCTNTANEECSFEEQVGFVATCKAQSEDVEKCKEFWKSDAEFGSFADIDLKAPFCGEKHFYYNRVAVNAPVCTMECKEGGSDCDPKERTMMSQFYVQGYGNTGASALADCLSSVMKLVYRNHEIVPCGQLGDVTRSILSVYRMPRHSAETMPWTAAAAACGSTVQYGFFSLSNNLDPAHDICASSDCPGMEEGEKQCLAVSKTGEMLSSFAELKDKTAGCGGHVLGSASVRVNLPICTQHCARTENCPPWGKPFMAPFVVEGTGSADCLASTVLRLYSNCFFPKTCIELHGQGGRQLQIYDANGEYAYLKRLNVSDARSCGAEVQTVSWDLNDMFRYRVDPVTSC